MHVGLSPFISFFPSSVCLSILFINCNQQVYMYSAKVSAWPSFFLTLVIFFFILFRLSSWLYFCIFFLSWLLYICFFSSSSPFISFCLCIKLALRENPSDDFHVGLCLYNCLMLCVCDACACIRGVLPNNWYNFFQSHAFVATTYSYEDHLSIKIWVQILTCPQARC